ncbi:NAD(P)H-hydrate dehydratase [Reichenbachiella ulvae]|uniref:Bifunctional NAD(P)H-hydrate repair enzyme n=1 Tax=Reichenbachiella ulvae TaxID=2980104 RepID=A0ABT3CZJ2_9BACT|nr:NAD(P)H-hydrate dehydratase [Reichenbachiella ulvae]MCV9388973.1 NAD(P)H-hydrate dehydratase [Reichenbachiella ulvae]
MNFNLCQKILSPQQIQLLDQMTIKTEPIPSIDLMERASEAFVSSFIQSYPRDRSVVVVAGTGNNGGDGMAIARLLVEQGYKVEAFVVGKPEKGSKDFQANHAVLKAYCSCDIIASKEDFPVLDSAVVVVDALFGSGLSRAVSGLFGELIDYLNEQSLEAVAVDIASGLGCDQVFEGGRILRVSQTITFEVPKYTQLLAEFEPYVGELNVVNIGLDLRQMEASITQRYFVTPQFITSLFRSKSKYAHKGTAGRCLLLVGSQGKMGAAVLAARACLRSGAGLLTTYIPQSGNQIMQIAVPEAMTITSPSLDVLSHSPDLDGYHAVGIGPGLGMEKETGMMVKAILVDSALPLVLDADALNIIARENSASLIPRGSVLTPHPGEFKRLVGDWKNDFEKLEKQRAFSREYQVVVVLKGANSSITDLEGNIFFNSSGNPGMATGGSGDVLTGIITAFLGQGYGGLEAALLATYLHGLSGDLALEHGSTETLIASDLINFLPRAFRKAQTRPS